MTNSFVISLLVEGRSGAKYGGNVIEGSRCIKLSSARWIEISGQDVGHVRKLSTAERIDRRRLRRQRNKSRPVANQPRRPCSPSFLGIALIRCAAIYRSSYLILRPSSSWSIIRDGGTSSTAASVRRRTYVRALLPKPQARTTLQGVFGL